nr:Chain C, LYS-ALA-GLY-GLN-VAL-VAL-THR-ILE-TRP [synthetic construct]
KAGQVVTIW